ncbi:DEAD/DEAH box helicase [Candidatus Woesearchaeota archaeon]|nr:DEAD/DEAH box helicase [Candidatus Woesearchaeota archaeon]
MQFRTYTLDPFQEEAIHAIGQNASVLVSAPTGSGKTLIADYIIDKDIKEGKRVIYTAPIKALSNQKYKDFTHQYGSDTIGLITGDIVIQPRAQVLIMTTEIYRNMAIAKDPLLEDVSYCIMDEIHFISDEERGYIWEESIIFSPPHIRFLFLSATIPNAKEFAGWVKKIKAHDVAIIQHTDRPVPLQVLFYDATFGLTSLAKIHQQRELDKVPVYYNPYHRKSFQKQFVPRPSFTEVVGALAKEQKLPCIYFVFSRAKTQEYAKKLASGQILFPHHPKLHQRIGQLFQQISPEVVTLPSTKLLRQCLGKGIGFHHAGLLPDVKEIVEVLFGEGLLQVLFATETFAVGVNMPARSVCFDGLRKYTGKGFRYLTSKEFFQIAGRAGRRGMDRVGYAIALVDRKTDDLGRIKVFTTADTLPLRSQFKLSYNTVLNMVHRHSVQEIEQLLMMNLYTYQQLKEKHRNAFVLRSIKARYTRIVKTLMQMGYIHEGELTALGMFTIQIYSNELEISQLFGTASFSLDEYTILLLLACLVYEPKRDTRFFHTVPSRKITTLQQHLSHHPYLKKGKWWHQMEQLTALIQPCYEHKKFIELLQNTTMPEGDIIRLFMQLLDKLEQIDRASQDETLIAKVRNAKYLIRSCLEGIHVF